MRGNPNIFKSVGSQDKAADGDLQSQDWSEPRLIPVQERRSRQAGQDSRQRLLHAALRCFAEHGYAKTSTRLIAQAAGANVAAIRYYFGDKAGIYRAAFTEPMGSVEQEIALFDGEDLSLEQALNGMLTGIIAPLKRGELTQMCTKLHLREIVEPTGLWQEKINNDISQHQMAISKVLCRHMSLKEPDDDLYRLQFAILGMAFFMYMGRDVYTTLQPQLMDTPQALDAMQARLLGHALAMVQAEQERRIAANSQSSLEEKKRSHNE